MTLRILRITLIAALLLGLGFVGAKEGVNGFRGADDIGQRVAGISQIVYGWSALLTLWAVLRAKWWYRLPLWLWGAGLALTALLAPVVWGGSTWTNAMYISIVTVLVAIAVGIGCGAHVRWRNKVLSEKEFRSR
jgi:hypothetical protein